MAAPGLMEESGASKTILLASVVAGVLAAAGCANSRCASCSVCAPKSGGTATYNPTNDVTRISNEGHTWYLKGNQTNVMVYPTE